MALEKIEKLSTIPCSTSNIELELPAKKIIEGYKKALNIDVEKYFEGIDNIYLHKCKKTKYRYFQPSTIAGDGKFYEELQKFQWYYSKDKWEFDVARTIISEGSVLEIGCGTGNFLYSLLENDKLKIKGIEFNEKAIQEGTLKGIDIENLDLRDITSNTYDYIVAFQVLEHISDINLFFSNCNRILKNHGKLIIGVPNTNSFIFKPFSNYYFTHGSLLLNLPPHHMGWWKKSSLKKAGKCYGFRLTNCLYEPLPDFRKQLVDENWKLTFKIYLLHRLLRKLFSKWYYQLFKGETILVVLKKSKNV